VSLSSVIADVFDRRQTLAQDLDLAVELEAIASARAGDSDAIALLIRAYAPVLRAQVGRHRATLDRDEAIAAALEAVTLAVHECPEGERLALVLPRRLWHALGGAASEASSEMTVPKRTVQRFFSILRKADGDFELAATLAPEHKMSRETFEEVRVAVGRVDRLEGGTFPHLDNADGREDPDIRDTWRGSIENARPIWTGSAPDAEVSELVDLAFDAVNPLEAEVIRLAYGFSDYDPVPDAEIAVRLGVNRVTAWRYRTRGLDKMRVALAADAAEGLAA
jgi:DNA-directed RNA polymerase specialized sigma24 family protein